MSIDHSSWTSIDTTDDPDSFVRFLQASRQKAIELAERDPAAFFSYLDLHPGDHVLDAACGLGDVTQLLARLIGPSGLAVGIDNSETMIHYARSHTDTALPVDFRTGDITALDFPDNSFDKSRAEQVLQHLTHPERAVAELVRVTRPGGRVVIMEPDWDTLVIDADDLDTSRAVARYVGERVVRHGAVGRQLRSLFLDAGLSNVSIEAGGIVPAYSSTREFVETSLSRAISDGTIDKGRGSAWMEDIHRRGENGRYFAAFMMFRVSGVVPS